MLLCLCCKRWTWCSIHFQFFLSISGVSIWLSACSSRTVTMCMVTARCLPYIGMRTASRTRLNAASEAPARRGQGIVFKAFLQNHFTSLHAIHVAASYVRQPRCTYLQGWLPRMLHTCAVHAQSKRGSLMAEHHTHIRYSKQLYFLWSLLNRWLKLVIATMKRKLPLSCLVLNVPQ